MVPREFRPLDDSRFFILGGISMKDAEEQFIKYTDSYRKYGEKIILKINHTMRVEKLCEEIARSLNLKEDDINLAAMCGLLHDIGRFEQWKKYQTYNDLKSIDHGDLGEKLLKENHLINRFTNNQVNTVLRAVKYHNKYRVPKTISERNKLFVDITRDADKIDILYLFVKGELYTKTEESKMSDEIIHALKEKRLIRKDETKTKADEIAIRLAFLFDINFKKSYDIILENDYINKMIDIQIEESNNKELKEQLEELRAYLNQYIGEMIKC